LFLLTYADHTKHLSPRQTLLSYRIVDRHRHITYTTHPCRASFVKVKIQWSDQLEVTVATGRCSGTTLHKQTDRQTERQADRWTKK